MLAAKNIANEASQNKNEANTITAPMFLCVLGLMYLLDGKTDAIRNRKDKEGYQSNDRLVRLERVPPSTPCRSKLFPYKAFSGTTSSHFGTRTRPHRKLQYRRQRYFYLPSV